MQAVFTRKAPAATVVLALAGGAALLLTGCSNHAIVAGNIVSMLVTFALFYTTINLRPGRM